MQHATVQNLNGIAWRKRPATVPPPGELSRVALLIIIANVTMQLRSQGSTSVIIFNNSTHAVFQSESNAQSRDHLTGTTDCANSESSSMLFTTPTVVCRPRPCSMWYSWIGYVNLTNRIECCMRVGCSNTDYRMFIETNISRHHKSVLFLN